MQNLRSSVSITNRIHHYGGICNQKAVVKHLSTAAPSTSDVPDVKPFEDIPGPKGLPYFGTYFKYKMRVISPSNLLDTLKDWHQQYGNIVKETLLGHTIVHVFDPEAYRTVYANEDKWPRIEPLAATIQRYRITSGYSAGLGNSNDEEWYRLRSVVQQLMMRPKQVVPFLPASDKVAIDFISRLKSLRNHDNEVPDCTAELSKWTLESAGMNTFSRRMGYLTEEGQTEAEEIISANSKVFELTAHLLFSLPLYQQTGIMTPKWKRLFDAEDLLYRIVLKNMASAVDHIKEKVDKDEVKEEDFIFLRYLVFRKELFTKDVASLAHSLFYDGLSTVTPQMQFLLYLLAVNPEVQDRLYEEIQSVAPPFPAPLTADAIGHMPYLKACVKESFRMLPMTGEISRITKKDMVLGGYHIPANTSLHLDNHALYRHPDYFDDPDVYMPERWLQKRSVQTIHPYILQPFGHGPRMCAGRRFAEQDMALLLIRLLQNFRLEWHHAPMGLKYRTLNIPDCPAQYTFCDR